MITTTPDRIADRAREAVENGASAVMLNFFAAGFGSLEILRFSGTQFCPRLVTKLVTASVIGATSGLPPR